MNLWDVETLYKLEGTEAILEGNWSNFRRKLEVLILDGLKIGAVCVHMHYIYKN